MNDSSSTVGLVIRGIAHRGDEAMARRALQHADRVIIAVAPGPDVERRLAAARAMCARYLPPDRAETIALPEASDAGATLRAAGATVVVGLEPTDGALVRCGLCGIVPAITCVHGGEPPDEAAARALAAPGALPGDLFRPEVAALLGRRLATVADRGTGAILWFTGMSGAGKSTLSQALARHLAGTVPLEVLDGDEVREHLSRGLTFSREDRDINVHRIGFVARTLARHGVVVITAAISPYLASRSEVRALAEAAGVAFVEIYARAELASLVERDVKGLYKKALANEIPHFTGVSDPYEAPPSPDVEAYTDRETVDESVARILAVLRARGIAP
jgi:adenylylsulfate kinase